MPYTTRAHDIFSLAAAAAVVYIISYISDSGGKKNSQRMIVLRSISTVTAVLLCALLERGVQNIFSLSAALSVILVAPIMEESVRLTLLRGFEIDSMRDAVWLSGLMGISESLFIFSFLENAGEVMFFRVMTSVPFHAFAGGIIFRRSSGIISTIILHSLLNYGVVSGGKTGVTLSIAAVVTASGIWYMQLIALQSERAEEKSPKLQ